MLNASSLSGTSIANALARPPPQQCQRCSRLVVRAEDAPPLLAAKPALRPPPPRPKPAPTFQRLDPPRTRQARQENYDNRSTRAPDNSQGNGDGGYQNRQAVRTLEPPEVPSDISNGVGNQSPPPPRPPVSRPLPASNGAVAPKPRSLEGAIAPIRPMRPTRPQVEQSQSRESPSGPPQRPPAAARQALSGPPPAGDARGKGRPVVAGKGGYAKAEGDGPPRSRMGGRPAGGAVRGPKRGKQTASARRQTRGTRRREREMAREAGAAVRQELFEVGDEGMPVFELAETLALGAAEVVKILFMKGLMVQVNQVLDKETVKMVVDEFEDVEVLFRDGTRVEEAARKTNDWLDEEDMEHLVARPPVVTVMGHVDHGKTSLLDFIRKAKVASGEAGGITQAIGAYTVEVPHEGEDRQITFLDTPGHEAFSAMRARGTKVTDIAIIVVAADDGVRPQSIEAISHAKAAGVPIIVALNKIDKEGANPERVKQELSEAGLLPEEWGGQTAVVSISAKKGTGVDELLEQILLVAEVEELVANPGRMAKGTVIEAHLDKKSGPVATLLVQAGTLRVGDVVTASATYGRVRMLVDSAGAEVQDAPPSIAVQMSGLSAVPTAGDEWEVWSSESEARKAADAAEQQERLTRLAANAGGGSMITSKSLATNDDDEALKRFNVILKADASGTMEAVKSALGSLPQDSVVLRYLLAAANEITTSDVDLAAVSGAIVLGFNVEPSEAVMAAAKRQGVEVKAYKVIYDLLDDMRKVMEGQLSTVEERILLGSAEVRAVFGSDKRSVAGCMVTEGLLRKKSVVVVKRGKRIVYDGPLSSLRRVKDVVNEVGTGLECGVGCDGYSDWKEGDTIQAFEVKEKRRTLEEAAITATIDEEDA